MRYWLIIITWSLLSRTPLSLFISTNLVYPPFFLHLLSFFVDGTISADRFPLFCPCYSCIICATQWMVPDLWIPLSGETIAAASWVHTPGTSSSLSPPSIQHSWKKRKHLLSLVQGLLLNSACRLIKWSLLAETHSTLKSIHTSLFEYFLSLSVLRVCVLMDCLSLL